jgi:hypothetical protein
MPFSAIAELLVQSMCLYIGLLTYVHIEKHRDIGMNVRSFAGQKNQLKNLTIKNDVEKVCVMAQWQWPK